MRRRTIQRENVSTQTLEFGHFSDDDLISNQDRNQDENEKGEDDQTPRKSILNDEMDHSSKADKRNESNRIEPSPTEPKPADPDHGTLRFRGPPGINVNLEVDHSGQNQSETFRTPSK